MNMSRRTATTPDSENNNDSTTTTSYTTASTASTNPATPTNPTQSQTPGFHSLSFLKGIVVTLLAVSLFNAVLDAETLRLPAEKRDLKWLDLPFGKKKDKEATATTATTTATATNDGWSTAIATHKASSTTSSTTAASSLPYDNNNDNNDSDSDADPGPVGPTCLGLGDGEELDRMLSRYDLIYVISHAKSGSSTMKFFAQDCSGLQTHDADTLYTPRTTQKFLRREYIVPPFISSRMTNDRQFLHLTRNAITNSLVIYIHREDTDRFKSGIRQVLGKKKEIKTPKTSKKSSKATVTRVNRGKIIDEEDVFEEIEAKTGEIGLSGARLLTCRVYESIEENRSNVVFLNIDKLDDLMGLLVKNFCPSYRDKKNRGHINMGVNKDPKEIRLGRQSRQSAKQTGHKNGTVPLEEWIDAKWPLLEHAFEQRDGASCHGETLRIEQKVFACPDRTYWYSSHEFPEDSWKPFTKAVGKTRSPIDGSSYSLPEKEDEEEEIDDDNEIPEEWLDDDDDDDSR